MRCQRFLVALGDYLDGELGGGSLGEVDRHIQECPRCLIVWSTTRKTIELYRSVDPCPIPVEIEARLMAAIETRAGYLDG